MIRRSCAVVVQAVAMLALVQVASAQTVDELVAKNIQAKGGEQTIKGIQSIKQTASMAMMGMPDGTEISLTTYAKRPNLMRQEMNMAGQQIVMAFDGTTVWTINPMMGSTSPMPLTGPEGDMLKEQASFDGPLMDYKSRGTTVTLVGTETVGGRQMHHLKVTSKAGVSQEVYLDAATGLEARVVLQMPQGEMVQELGDYRDVGGMKVPFSIRIFQMGQQVGEMKITNVEFNAPMDDALFKMK
jgi:outer membrane lipoprotein-sorting protein